MSLSDEVNHLFLSKMLKNLTFPVFFPNGSNSCHVPVRKWEGGTGKEESVLWKSWNLCFHHMALILALLKAFAD